MSGIRSLAARRKWGPEIELSALGRQCLLRRIAKQQTLSEQIEFWQTQRNDAKTKVDWQFTNADARIKLKRLYPSHHD